MYKEEKKKKDARAKDDKARKLEESKKKKRNKIVEKARKVEESKKKKGNKTAEKARKVEESEEGGTVQKEVEPVYNGREGQEKRGCFGGRG